VSAWAEIVYADSSDEWRAMCSRALAEVQDGQRRKDAAKIREGCNCLAGSGTCDVAAARIDPEVSDVG
jgi:hypothetical protein